MYGCFLPRLKQSLTVISLSSILSLNICSELILSLSIYTFLLSCIFSANPYITSFPAISLESVLAWFGFVALLIVVDKLLCFVVFLRKTLISLSIDEKSLPVLMDCFKGVRFFISEVSFRIVNICSLFCCIENITSAKWFWIAKFVFWILFVIFSKDCLNLSFFIFMSKQSSHFQNKPFTLPKFWRTSLGNLLQVPQISHE